MARVSAGIELHSGGAQFDVGWAPRARVSRWLSFEAHSGGGAGDRAGADVESALQLEQLAQLEREFHADTARRMRPLRVSMIALVFVASVAQCFAVTDALHPFRVTAAVLQGAFTALLFVRPREGSALFSLALLCLSGAARASCCLRKIRPPPPRGA